MERLWAPWRMKYVAAPREEKGCFLCRAWEDGDLRAHRVLYKGAAAFVIMNIYPYNNGHLMVASARHEGDLSALPAAERGEIMETVELCLRALKGAFSPQGFNVGANLGAAAGAGLEQHLHLHVVPRWVGDTNYMPIVGDIKVISQHIDETYDKLKGYFVA